MAKNKQEKVKAFCKQHDLNAPVEYRLLDVVSEIGEVAKEILKTTKYGRSSMRRGPGLEEELGDTYFSLMTLADAVDVDLEKALDKVIAKYQRRLRKGSPGSENTQNGR